MGSPRQSPTAPVGAIGRRRPDQQAPRKSDGGPLRERWRTPGSAENSGDKTLPIITPRSTAQRRRLGQCQHPPRRRRRVPPPRHLARRARARRCEPRGLRRRVPRCRARFEQRLDGSRRSASLGRSQPQRQTGVLATAQEVRRGCVRGAVAAHRPAGSRRPARRAFPATATIDRRLRNAIPSSTTPLTPLGRITGGSVNFDGPVFTRIRAKNRPPARAVFA